MVTTLLTTAEAARKTKNTDTGTTTSYAAVIKGKDSANLTEDNDPDGDNLLEASGKLKVSDRNQGEAAFIATTLTGQFGGVVIAEAGQWYYAAENDQAAIQALNSNDTVTDQLIVNTIDGTSHTITIYIKGEDEPVTTETAASTSTGSTDTSSSDTSSTNTGTTDTTTTVSNSPAIISGTDTGKVTEDWDDNNDGLLGWTGKLDITDSDAGEASFVATTVYSDYGSIQIDSSGNWFYGAINTLESIQSLNSGETLTDILTVASIDGTTHDVTITINGVDEPVAADTTSSDSTSTDTTTDTAATAVDINLSWTAPAEREDNTVLSLSEIAGYKIYYGTTQGNYTNSVDVNDSTTTSYTFKSLVAGTYYFVITTRDVDGRESQYSTEIITTI